MYQYQLPLVIFVLGSCIGFMAGSQSRFFDSKPPGRPLLASHQNQAASMSLMSGLTSPNLWADLSIDEVQRVWEYLKTDESGMNLTSVHHASSWDNIILTTEILRPNKSDALAFLELGAPAPDRYARVTVRRNSLQIPLIEEHMVGPLRANVSMQIQPLGFLYNSGRSWTVNPTPDVNLLTDWFDQIGEGVADIVQDLVGGQATLFRELDASAFEATSNDAFELQDGRQTRWVTFMQKAAASTLLPGPLYFKVDTTGRDPSKWRVLRWWYNGILYNGTDEFRAAWGLPDFEKLPSNLDGAWTAMQPSLFARPKGERAGNQPVFFQPQPPRVKIDDAGRFVSWMGIDFSIAFSQATGVSLFNIRVNGERVIYELGLQEAMAHYAGADPIQSGTAFLDTVFGFGARLSPLVPGFDCPEYAHYLSTTYHRMERTETGEGTICIFEAPTDHPLQRHSDGSTTTSFTNSILILRSIAVVGNYDYLLDYIFYLDGTVEVKVRASGYIQGAYPAQHEKYGYRVHEHFFSSIHDHILNFKADLDIAGPKNNLTVIKLQAKDVPYAWAESGVRHTMIMNRTQIESEDESTLDWPANGADMYVITGDENRYGEARGYRIMPGTGIGSPVHLIPQNSSNLLKSAAWATHDLFITKQKDTEVNSARPANMLSPSDPLIDFDRFLDGESLVDEDLVVWFNLGSHHVPHSGDIPNTLMTTSASSVMFAPHNFHHRDRSSGLTQGVHAKFQKDTGLWTLGRYGSSGKILQDQEGGALPIRKLPAMDADTAM